MNNLYNSMMPVPFRDATLYLVDDHGEPQVPMKPVVDGMDLAWKPQYVKLTSPDSRWNSTITMMVTVAEDGKSREMICLPLKKLPGWLMSIDPNKVKPEIRDKIITYQNECDDVLWDYWSNKRNEAFGASAGYRPAALQGHEPGSLVPIAREFTGALRLALKHGFSVRAARAQANTLIRDAYHIDTGKLFGLDYDQICPPEQLQTERNRIIHDTNTELVDAFWAAYYKLETEHRHTVNHSKNPDIIAININQFVATCQERGIPLPPAVELKRNLKGSANPAFIKIDTVASAITGRATKCWRFSA